jgi:hypothetical protein
VAIFRRFSASDQYHVIFQIWDELTPLTLFICFIVKPFFKNKTIPHPPGLSLSSVLYQNKKFVPPWFILELPFGGLAIFSISFFLKISWIMRNLTV